MIGDMIAGVSWYDCWS